MEGRRRWDPRWAVAAGMVALLLASGLGLALDLDRDGDATLQELRAGTRPWDGVGSPGTELEFAL